MLLTCSSCNSRYLLNSLDLKPNGRIVRCATCNYEWFQELKLVEKETLDLSVESAFKEENNKLKQEKTSVSNLPSTYIKETGPSTLNSIVIILFFIIIVTVLWLIKKEGIGLMVLSNYYIQEFYFNLKLIINDIARLLHQILN